MTNDENEIIMVKNTIMRIFHDAYGYNIFT